MSSTMSLIILLVIIFIIVQTTLLFLLPFFIFRIRNEIIEINKEIKRISNTIKGDTKQETEGNTEQKTEFIDSKDRKIIVDSKGRKVKICPHCGQKNRLEDYKCLKCRRPLN